MLVSIFYSRERTHRAQKKGIEIKAAKNLTNEHEAQLLGYLKSSRVEHGLLINFGSFKFQIKKYVFSQDGTP